MPIEVKELIIKTIVTNEKAGKKTPSDSVPDDMKKKIITACVDQVLRILARKEER